MDWIDDLEEICDLSTYFQLHILKLFGD